MRSRRLAFYEGWDLANSTAFDATKWTVTSTGCTVNVQSSAARFAFAGVTGGYAETGGAQGPRILVNNTDFDFTFDVSFSSITAENYASLFIGDSHNGGGVALNGVGLSVSAAFSTVTIQRRDAGVQADLIQGFWTPTAATFYRLRFKREGPEYSVKIWLPTTAEPSDWLVQATEYNYRSPQYGSIILGGLAGNVAAATNLNYDNLIVYELNSNGGRRRRAGALNSTLGTASLSVTANDLDIALRTSVASLDLAANPIGVNLTLPSASLSLSANALSRNGGTALGSASLNLVANGIAESLNLGTAALGLSSFSISGTRTLNSAALAFVANAISQTRAFNKADVGFVATSLDTISLGAEPIGQGRTLPSSTLGLSAYNFTYGGQVLPGASVALAAALLGSSRTFTGASLGITGNSLASSLTLSPATLGMTAYGLTVAAITATANLGNATIGFTANPFTFNDTIIAIAASLGISASALGITGSLGIGTATLALLASNLADSETTTAASLGLAATDLTASSRSPGAATVPFSASGMTTAGYALASASITAIANNLSLLGSFALGTATVAFSAFNMTNQTTGQATLGRGNLSVNAQNLSVSLSAGLSASLAMSATNLARAAVVGTASVSLAAVGLTALRTSAMGLASLVTTAYDMSQSAPGSAALGSGTLLLSANPMTRFALLSAGLATVALDANAIQPKVNASGAVGSMSTAAQPMSSTRAVGNGILDLTAYGFGAYRPSALGAAALTVTAYALSAQTGKSKGKITVRNGYVQFKTGGRVLAGPKVANPIS